MQQKIMKYKEIVNFIVKHRKEADNEGYCEQCKKPWLDGFCECDGAFDELWQGQCGVVSYLLYKYDITEEIIRLYEYLIEKPIKEIIDKGRSRKDIIDTILFEEFENIERTIGDARIVSEINLLIDGEIGSENEIVEEHYRINGKLLTGNLYVREYTPNSFNEAKIRNDKIFG